jgi:hypothetical protein
MDEDVWEYFLDMSKPLAECNAPLVERTATAAKRYSFGHFFDVICKHVRPYQTVGRVGIYATQALEAWQGHFISNLGFEPFMTFYKLSALIRKTIFYCGPSRLQMKCRAEPPPPLLWLMILVHLACWVSGHLVETW